MKHEKEKYNYVKYNNTFFKCGIMSCKSGK